ISPDIGRRSEPCLLRDTAHERPGGPLHSPRLGGSTLEPAGVIALDLPGHAVRRLSTPGAGSSTGADGRPILFLIALWRGPDGATTVEKKPGCVKTQSRADYPWNRAASPRRHVNSRTPHGIAVIAIREQAA